MKPVERIFLLLAATLFLTAPALARNSIVGVIPANVTDQTISFRVEATPGQSGERFVVTVSAKENGLPHYFHKGEDMSPFLSAALVRGPAGVARGDTRGTQVIARPVGGKGADGAAVYRFTVPHRDLDSTYFQVVMTPGRGIPAAQVPEGRFRMGPYHCAYYLVLWKFVLQPTQVGAGRPADGSDTTSGLTRASGGHQQSQSGGLR